MKICEVIQKLWHIQVKSRVELSGVELSQSQVLGIFQGDQQWISQYKIWIPGEILSNLLFWSLKICQGVQKLWYFQVRVE